MGALLRKLVWPAQEFRQRLRPLFTSRRQVERRIIRRFFTVTQENDLGRLTAGHRHSQQEDGKADFHLARHRRVIVK